MVMEKVSNPIIYDKLGSIIQIVAGAGAPTKTVKYVTVPLAPKSLLRRNETRIFRVDYDGKATLDLQVVGKCGDETIRVPFSAELECIPGRESDLAAFLRTGPPEQTIREHIRKTTLELFESHAGIALSLSIAWPRIAKHLETHLLIIGLKATLSAQFSQDHDSVLTLKINASLQCEVEKVQHSVKLSVGTVQVENRVKPGLDLEFEVKKRLEQFVSASITRYEASLFPAEVAKRLELYLTDWARPLDLQIRVLAYDAEVQIDASRLRVPFQEIFKAGPLSFEMRALFELESGFRQTLGNAKVEEAIATRVKSLCQLLAPGKKNYGTFQGEVLEDAIAVARSLGYGCSSISFDWLKHELHASDSFDRELNLGGKKIKIALVVAAHDVTRIESAQWLGTAVSPMAWLDDFVASNLGRLAQKASTFAVFQGELRTKIEEGLCGLGSRAEEFSCSWLRQLGHLWKHRTTAECDIDIDSKSFRFVTTMRSEDDTMFELAEWRDMLPPPNEWLIHALAPIADQAARCASTLKEFEMSLQQELQAVSKSIGCTVERFACRWLNRPSVAEDEILDELFVVSGREFHIKGRFSAEHGESFEKLAWLGKLVAPAELVRGHIAEWALDALTETTGPKEYKDKFKGKITTAARELSYSLPSLHCMWSHREVQSSLDFSHSISDREVTVAIEARLELADEHVSLQALWNRSNTELDDSLKRNLELRIKQIIEVERIPEKLEQEIRTSVEQSAAAIGYRVATYHPRVSQSPDLRWSLEESIESNGFVYQISATVVIKELDVYLKETKSRHITDVKGWVRETLKTRVIASTSRSSMGMDALQKTVKQDLEGNISKVGYTLERFLITAMLAPVRVRILDELIGECRKEIQDLGSSIQGLNEHISKLRLADPDKNENEIRRHEGTVGGNKQKISETIAEIGRLELAKLAKPGFEQEGGDLPMLNS
jgi:hypothetical protein